LLGLLSRLLCGGGNGGRQCEGQDQGPTVPAHERVHDWSLLSQICHALGLQPCLPECFLLVCLDSTWRSSKMAKEILCGFGIDVDAVAGWLGSYGGED